MKTKALFIVRTIAIWLAFLGIALIYLFGVSASQVVDFISHESFGPVCGRVISAEFGPVDFSYHGWILAVAVGWWMILWTLLGILDFRKLKRKNENAAPHEAERRFDRRAGEFKREPGAWP